MVKSEHKSEVAGFIAFAKTQFSAAPLSPHVLELILERLERLALRRDFWFAPEYPDAPPGEEGPLYLISEEPDHSLALYLNVLTPGMKFPPHNHTTWACVAAIDGVERNFLYDRLDDGSMMGHATIRLSETIDVAPGRAIALMPDDIHAIENASGQSTRHLHFYGRALEFQSERLTFDVEAGTCCVMPILSEAQ